ncbi:RNA-directed DNA polymerase, eukaryota, partial [Tanacetum coccineum]
NGNRKDNGRVFLLESWDGRAIDLVPLAPHKQCVIGTLFAVIESHLARPRVVLGVTPDRWYWTLDGSGEFSVASARKVIDDNRFPEVSNQTRWIKAVPIKVNIHAWKVRMDCLPTRLNISRRGIDIPSILCPVCGSVTESSSHLFFDCLVAKDNFRKICRWWEVDFMEVHTFDEWVSWIVNLRIPIKHKRLLEGLMEFSSGKIIMAIERGYNLESLANSILACVEVLLKDKHITESTDDYPFESTLRVIKALTEGPTIDFVPGRIQMSRLTKDVFLIYDRASLDLMWSAQRLDAIIGKQTDYMQTLVHISRDEFRVKKSEDEDVRSSVCISMWGSFNVRDDLYKTRHCQHAVGVVSRKSGSKLPSVRGHVNTGSRICAGAKLASSRNPAFSFKDKSNIRVIITSYRVKVGKKEVDMQENS